MKNNLNNKIKTIFLIVAVVLGIVCIAGVIVFFRYHPEPPELNNDGIVDYSDQVQITPVPTPEPLTVLPGLAELYEKNSDLAGWISIEGTELDYAYMYTPDDPEKYLHKGIEGAYSVAGSIFMDANCTFDPINGNESDNLLFHGHNMRDGSMFRTLIKYKNESFWESHPIIKLSTLYDEREYEILAAFYDRVYYTHETCFKYYKFIDAADEAAYNEAITYYKDHALYDTGVTAEYGDKLITLSTCDYHVDNGRFVIVAKEIKANS